MYKQLKENINYKLILKKLWCDSKIQLRDEIIHEEVNGGWVYQRVVVHKWIIVQKLVMVSLSRE